MNLQEIEIDLFNNRETSIVIWVVLLVVWGSRYSSVRKIFYDLIKVFGKRLILTMFGLMAAYIGLLIYGLYEVGLWDTGQLKNTVIWSVSIAAVYLVRSNKIADDPNFYRNAIKDNLKLVVVLEFIIAFYTFDLWVEFLIVPLVVVAGGMLAVAQSNKEYEPAEKFLSNILALFGGGLIAYAIYNLYLDFELFAKTQTLTDFILPPLLSLLFLPFLFIIALYSSYESAFTRLQFSLNDSSLRTFAKRRSIIGFHVHTGLLKRWTRNLMILCPENRQQIKDSIREVKMLRARERNPEKTPFERGWSPYAATEFLTEEGLHPDDYHRIFGEGNEWAANSPYMKVGDEFLLNSIAYYIDGDEFTATKLRLIMEIIDPQSSENDHQQFTKIARLLFEKALNSEMPEELENHLLAGTDTTTHLRGKEMSVLKTVWPKHHLSGYTLKFTIQNVSR